MSATLRVGLFGRRLLTRSLVVWAVLFSAAFAGPSSATAINRQASPGAAGGNPKATHGYDISYPQCGGAYPTNAAFGIVGVNGGRVFSANPCISSQVRWAGGMRAQLYANTGNPGPDLSSHWPTGQESPKSCSTTTPDTADCAYDYGWNAAADSYGTAAATYSTLGLAAPNSATWWLDVETSNSWRTDVGLNVAALQGEVAYLRSVGVTAIGVYSTAYQWGVITGSSAAFGGQASWIAGARSEKDARSRCTGPSFTGGRVALAQYIVSGFDADVAC